MKPEFYSFLKLKTKLHITVGDSLYSAINQIIYRNKIKSTCPLFMYLFTKLWLSGWDCFKSWEGLFEVTLTELSFNNLNRNHHQSQVNCGLSVDGWCKCLLLLTWLVNKVKMPMVVCQLSHNVIGFEDYKWLVHSDPPFVCQKSVGLFLVKLITSQFVYCLSILLMLLISCLWGAGSWWQQFSSICSKLVNINQPNPEWIIDSNPYCR